MNIPIIIKPYLICDYIKRIREITNINSILKTFTGKHKKTHKHINNTSSYFAAKHHITFLFFLFFLINVISVINTCDSWMSAKISSINKTL